MSPTMPFTYSFLDESFNEMYQSEQRVGKIAIIFSTLAILIACLGLFGLATFIAEQRTKEIGIRKVLGASVQGIVRLLSKDFLKLVAIAFVIAAPLSVWIMNRWLNDFTYRIHLEWWIVAARDCWPCSLPWQQLVFRPSKRRLRIRSIVSGLNRCDG